MGSVKSTKCPLSTMMCQDWVILKLRDEFVAALLTESGLYNGVSKPYAKIQSMVFNHGSSSCINETDGSIIKYQFECMNKSAPKTLGDRSYVAINAPDVLRTPQFFRESAKLYMKGNAQMGLDPHMNLVTQKSDIHDLSKYGFLPKKVLKQKGALKKYFDGSLENPQQKSKEWVRDFCSSL